MLSGPDMYVHGFHLAMVAHIGKQSSEAILISFSSTPHNHFVVWVNGGLYETFTFFLKKNREKYTCYRNLVFKETDTAFLFFLKLFVKSHPVDFAPFTNNVPNKRVNC